jgi:hypothetical protein
MTNQSQVSVQANSFRPRDYDVFASTLSKFDSLFHHTAA